MAGKRRPPHLLGDWAGGESGASAMDAAEVEFLAEKELVTIIPNFSLDKIYLIGVRARGATDAGKGRAAGASADAGSRISVPMSGRRTWRAWPARPA